jgi:hypothetical protein
MTTEYSAEFAFEDEGIVVTLGTPSESGDYEVVKVDDPSETPSYVRHVINFEIRESNKKITGDYPGQVSLEIGFEEGEENYWVFLYRNDGTPLEVYRNPSTSANVPSGFPSKYVGVFQITDDSFPDPNVGVGP